MLEIKTGIWISEDNLIFQAVRSSGPGGQHVNKVSSKIMLICPLKKINGISDKQTERIKEKLKSYIIDQEIRVTSQKHRSQYSNKQEAIKKLQSLLHKALKEKKPRFKTHVPKAIKEKRLKEKSIRSEIKTSRGLKPTKDE